MFTPYKAALISVGQKFHNFSQASVISKNGVPRMPSWNPLDILDGQDPAPLFSTIPGIVTEQRAAGLFSVLLRDPSMIL